MGVIRKKTGTRGTEGGLKYICDVCSGDITSTVRIHCADPMCHDFDLCVPCFSNGSSSRDHNPSTHSYSVIEQHSIPIFTEDWGADEELLLLEGAEAYGLGSWADIADHIGGFRTKEEVRDHYISSYVDSPNFPLPARADPEDLTLVKNLPREEFQARKKRRIEQRKEAAKNAPPAAPKQKPTSSVPSCHEIQGYMPGRLEFETEFFNDAEEAVQHMQFDPGDGLNPRTGELEPEMELKMVVMDIYNSKLTGRATRKKNIFEHGLLEYRRNAATDKKRTREERDLFGRIKPFARMMNHDDFVALWSGLEDEYHLRLAIGQLQDWRQHNIGDLRTGEKYEVEKTQRAVARPGAATGGGVFDRSGGGGTGSRPSRPPPPVETPPATIALVAPELPERLKSSLRPASAMKNGHATENHLPNGRDSRAPMTNGTSGTSANAIPPYSPESIHGISPLKLTFDNVPDLHLLTSEERDLCSTIRVMPKAYLAMKEGVLREATKAGGSLKKKTARDVCKIDTVKSGRLFDFFVRSGWIQKS